MNPVHAFRIHAACVHQEPARRLPCDYIYWMAGCARTGDNALRVRRCCAGEPMSNRVVECCARG